MSTLSSDELIKRAAQARRENRLSDAYRDAEEAVRLSRLAGTRAGLSRALMMLGQIERDEDRAEHALPYYQEALSLCREEGDSLRLAHTVRHLADLHRGACRLDLAASCYDEALTLYRTDQRTSPLDLANAVRGFALLKDGRGETEEGRRLWAEACALYLAGGVEEGVEECRARLRA